MHKQVFIAAAVLAAMSSTVSGQVQARRMTQVGGGGSDRGKCTIEVRVDGAAEVEIRGPNGILRNLSGAAPTWRRFECTGPLPANPGGFHFAGVDGRGRQQLIHEPRDGGAAVVRIDDPDNGSEGYTFDITWGNAPPPPPPPQGRGEDRDRHDDRDGDSFHHDRDDAFRGDDWRMHLFARIRQDLDHVQSETFRFGKDQYRITRTLMELDQLQDLQSHGRYDRRQLDDVVMALTGVVADNRLAPRDRDLLNDDLSRLREFGAHLHDYGVR